MSEETHNEDSGEEKKPLGDSHDEDFGLPDLEFEELQELDLNIDGDDDGDDTGNGGSEILQGSDDIDMSVLDDIEITESDSSEPLPEPPTMDIDPSSVVLDEGIDEVEDILDSAQLISDRLGDDDVDEIESTDLLSESSDFGSDINYDDLIGAASGEESSSEDLGLLGDFGDDNDEVVGLTDEEIAAIESMDLEDSDISPETGSDDLLAGVDGVDELAGLDFGDSLETPLAEEGIETDSLFSADSLVGSSVEDGLGDVGAEESAFSGEGEGSIFESDEISLQSEEQMDFEPAEEASLPSNYKPYTAEDGQSGNFTKVIVIGAVAFVLVGFILLWFFNQGGGQEGEEVAKVENVKKKTTKKIPIAKKKTTKKPAATTKKPAAKPAKKASAKPKAKPAESANPGEILAITDKSGRSYVIVGSFIDEDLAMDYAKDLSSKGNGVKIIHPFGDSRRYRVSIADFGSYQDAAGQLNTYKSAFGEQVWALKH